MSRPKLSSLSSLLPAKGAATRPEVVFRASEHESKQEDITAQPQKPGQLSIEHASKSASMIASQTSSVVAADRGDVVGKGHKDGSRSAVSFRMTENLQERLRLYAFETRRSKQDVLDDALHEYLLREGH